jgi:hypothetical protein
MPDREIEIVGGVLLPERSTSLELGVPLFGIESKVEFDVESKVVLVA